MSNLIKFVISFVLVGLTALLASYFSYQGIDTFYSKLNMPPLTPPNNVFPVMWGILYALMIVSYYIILTKENNQSAVLLFIGQLVLQVLWCFAFFARGYFLFGSIIIIMLLFTVFAMIREFQELDDKAAYLQYPYLLWILFATYLTLGVTYLNGISYI